MSKRFVESEHKRDERGRFAEMDTSVLKAQQAKKLKGGNNLHPEKAHGFSDKERKNTKHHIAHAKEMGFKNQDEYEKARVISLMEALESFIIAKEGKDSIVTIKRHSEW